jgi:hypothetical protein
MSASGSGWRVEEEGILEFTYSYLLITSLPLSVNTSSSSTIIFTRTLQAHPSEKRIDKMGEAKPLTAFQQTYHWRVSLPLCGSSTDLNP